MAFLPGATAVIRFSCNFRLYRNPVPARPVRPCCSTSQNLPSFCSRMRSAVRGPVSGPRGFCAPKAALTPVPGLPDAASAGRRLPQRTRPDMSRPWNTGAWILHARHGAIDLRRRGPGGAAEMAPLLGATNTITFLSFPRFGLTRRSARRSVPVRCLPIMTVLNEHSKITKRHLRSCWR